MPAQTVACSLRNRAWTVLVLPESVGMDDNVWACTGDPYEMNGLLWLDFNSYASHGHTIPSCYINTKHTNKPYHHTKITWLCRTITQKCPPSGMFSWMVWHLTPGLHLQVATQFKNSLAGLTDILMATRALVHPLPQAQRLQAARWGCGSNTPSGNTLIRLYMPCDLTLFEFISFHTVWCHVIPQLYLVLCDLKEWIWDFHTIIIPFWSQICDFTLSCNYIQYYIVMSRFDITLYGTL